ncbi:MAG: dephospho-CoA kinase [Caulobacteraceae bacterium]
MAPVEAAFPGVEEDGAINRARLSAQVVGNNQALDRLNGIVWPLLARPGASSSARPKKTGSPLSCWTSRCCSRPGASATWTRVVVVSAPADIQRQRVLAREDMNEAKLDAILARQMADAEKRARATLWSTRAKASMLPAPRSATSSPR